MKSPLLIDIAEWVVSLRLSAMPDEVVQKAKLCLLDSISASMTIGARFESEAALRMARRYESKGLASVFGTEFQMAPGLAAFVNGTSAICTTRSDTHEQSAGHPGSVVIPAALALGQSMRSPGSRVLEAIVAGYEVFCRFGHAIVTPRVSAAFRPTGLIGPLGSAMACAKLLELGTEACAASGGLSLHLMSGLNQWSLEGTSEHTLHSGTAARAGIDSALLAMDGVHSAVAMIEGQAGALAAYGELDNANRVMSPRKGDALSILSIQHKPAPTCIYAATPVQLAASMVQEPGFDIDQVSAIDVFVSEAAAKYPGCDRDSGFVSSQAAKMSIQFGVASVLRRGTMADENWIEFDRPDVVELAKHVKLHIDPRFDPMAGKIDVRLRSGQLISKGQGQVQSMTWHQIEDRFMAAAEPKLGQQAAKAAVAFIRDADALKDISDLCNLLRVTPGSK